VIAAGDEVPISVYAADVIGKLALEPGYPADFAARYQQNIVSREDNVRAVVTKVELGEGDAGIVYATDAAASNAVDVVPIPDGANVRVDYVGAIVAASPHQAAAAAFLGWLAGPEGQMVLGGFGFVAPAP
jgi:molybdate transport system substrate-binding protein